MRKKLICAVICLLSVTILIIGALAAEFTGRIWTGWPKRDPVLGIAYGYYCTAAKNSSANGTGQWAHAWSKNSAGEVMAEKRATGTNSAVANSDWARPSKGFGEYGEAGGGYASQSFGSGAYPTY